MHFKFINFFKASAAKLEIYIASYFESKVLPSYSKIASYLSSYVASYSHNTNNSWVVWAKYIAICKEGSCGGALHLCGFVICYVWEELFVGYYWSLVDIFSFMFLIIVIVEANA